jgi:hypothetical protein
MRQRGWVCYPYGSQGNAMIRGRTCDVEEDKWCRFKNLVLTSPNQLRGSLPFWILRTLTTKAMIRSIESTYLKPVLNRTWV